MTTMTPNQQQIISQATREWLAVGLDTSPADFEAAESAISRLYASIGKKSPHFVRLSSPLAAELYIHALCEFGKNPGAQLGAQLWDQLGAQLGAQLWDQLGAQLGDQLRAQLGAQPGAQLRDQLGAQLRDQLGAQLGGQLWDQLGAQLGAQLWAQLGAQLGDQLRAQLGAQLGAQLWAQLGAQLGGSKLKYMGTWFCGQQDAYSWGFYEAGRRLGACYHDKINSQLDDQCIVSKSIGWWYPFNDFCIITDRPEIINRDRDNNLHADQGPALKYRDGYSVYAHHGVRIPYWVVETPEKITMKKIMGSSIPQRAVMVEKYGFDKFVTAKGGNVLDSHTSDSGKLDLYQRSIDAENNLVMLRIENPSGEVLWRRVNPSMTKAVAALASTYGFDV